ncbi:MAG: hypothetical protein J4F28_02100 [Nitrosopumilaceae archaeon]|nr:hypothetical protein [Nitrosopumilaceae archaeon]
MSAKTTTGTTTAAASRQIQCHRCGRSMRSRLLPDGDTHRHYCAVCARGNRLCELRYDYDKHANGQCGGDKEKCAYCGSGLRMVYDSADRDVGRMMEEDREDPRSCLEQLCPVWFEKLRRGIHADLDTYDRDVVAEAWGWSDKYNEVGGDHFCLDCTTYGYIIFNGSYQFGSIWVELDRIGTAEHFAQHYLEMHDGRGDEKGRGAYLKACSNMISALDALEIFSLNCRELQYDDKKDHLLLLLGELRTRFKRDMHYKANAAYDKEDYDEVMEFFAHTEKNIREGFK